MNKYYCQCGCGGEIIIKPHHKSRGIPKYIHGHYLNVQNPMRGKFGNQHSKFGKPNPSKFKGIRNIQISKRQTGSNNSNWRNSSTPINKQIRTSLKYSNWRTQIFGRDNFTCQECGIRGTWLEVHHINTLSMIMKKHDIKKLEEAIQCDELWNINNGITLCKNCHKKYKMRNT